MSIKLVTKGITTLSGFNLTLYVIIERKNVKRFTIKIKNSPARRLTKNKLFMEGVGRSNRELSP